MNNLERAKFLVDFLHNGQKYGDGEDYIVHLEEVYKVLLEFGITEEEVLVSAWLHDIIEDTNAEYKLILKYFGINVSDIVYSVTNENGINRQERNLKTYMKISGNIKALCVKLADRIANSRRAKNNSNTKYINMYKKEYPVFRYYLKDETSCNAQNFGAAIKAMWKELDNLMDLEYA